MASPSTTYSATVETARGPIPVESLGRTLMHEHIFTMNAEYNLERPGKWDEEREVENAIAKLTKLKELGFDSMLDCTVLGLGRNVPRVARICNEVELNVVVATGAYATEEMPRLFALKGPGTLLGGPEPMTKMFLEDLTEGVGDSGVRAAFLKLAVENKSPVSERICRAITDAHTETGAPITVHTNGPRETGRIAVTYLEEFGADLTKVVIGHAGESDDIDYLRWIADKGAYIGFDRIGAEFNHTTENYVRKIALLATEGRADRVVLGHDAACSMQHFTDDFGKRKLAELAPDWNYTFIPKVVVPMLREQGVTEDQLETMLVTNPVRYFLGGTQ